MKTSQRIYLPLKRLIGILGSFVGIVVCFVFLWWWVIPVNAIVTRGHPFFARHRIGKDGKAFRCLKFRSMKLTADPHMTSRDTNIDSQVTEFRKFLRKTSIDETLQLFNVLVGQMASIFPRPLIVVTINKTNENSSIILRPGISDYAQINGREVVVPVAKGEMDGYYFERFSLWVDCSIFITTLFSAVKIGKGNKNED